MILFDLSSIGFSLINMEKILLEHLWIVIVVLLLTLPLKAAALWRSARRGHIGWFLTFIIVNTLGILELLYLFVFSNWGISKKKQQEAEEEIVQHVRQPRPEKFSAIVSSERNRPTIV